MKQVLLSYSASHLPRKLQTKISRELFGYQDISKHGKYSYHRKGLVASEKKIKPGCFLIDENEQGGVTSFFKKRKVKFVVTL
ncbi:hypothetical protein J4457_05560 [Candidatus Woesearchaeota archaeon]|nr:hypothetical protein [Candidatus Woesearchaeota archaeon]